MPATDPTFTFADADGFEIFVRRWTPAPGTAARAVVQIAHGAAEHSARYERVARFLNAAGFTVYADDHRGHGRTAGSLDRAGIAGPDGWNGMVRDLKQLTDILRREHPGLPVFLLGHSLGSLLAQRYVQLWGSELAGLVLSGTFGTLPELDATIAMLETLAAGSAGDEPSAAAAAMFSSFNLPFEPGRTGFEWLSRDEDEVQRYADDPWCGFPFSNRLIADVLEGAREIWKPENEVRVPKSLPVLMISGDRDPAGENTASVRALIDRYQAQGLQNVEHKFYRDARHELFNETNRDEVHRDLLRWLNARLE